MPDISNKRYSVLDTEGLKFFDVLPNGKNIEQRLIHDFSALTAPEIEAIIHLLYPTIDFRSYVGELKLNPTMLKHLAFKVSTLKDNEATLVDMSLGSDIEITIKTTDVLKHFAAKSMVIDSSKQ